MWVFTKDGFYSVVKDHHCKADQVVVRSRRAIDLKRFCEKVKIPDTDILTIPGADYRHRIIVPQAVWSYYLTQAGEEIDYPNFKNELDHADVDRHNAYFRVWSIMSAYQAWAEGRTDG